VAKKTKPEYTNAVAHDVFDRMAYQGMQDASKVLQGHAKTTKDGAVTKESSVMSDLFYGFYKMDPALKEDAPTAQKTVVETVWGLGEYKNLREYTQLDDVSSAMAVAQVAETALKEFEQLEQKLEQAEQNGDPEQGEAAKDQAMAKFRVAMRGALKDATEKVDGLAEGIGLLAGKDPSDLKSVPAKEKLRLAEMLVDNDSLQRIAKLAGRFINVVQASVANSPSHGYDEIVDITTGNDINRLIPAELMKLRYNKLLFFKDFSEGNLMQYNLKGEEKVGNGPIMMCLDMSGSMGMGDGQCAVWGKAVALALATLAERQKRAFYLNVFNGRVQREIMVPRGERLTMEQRLQIVGLQPGGGTEYYPAIMAAFAFRATQPTLKPADIVFITDGFANLNQTQVDEIQLLKQKTEVRIHGVGLENNEPINYDTLKLFADTINKITSNTDNKGAKTIITSAASLFA